MSGKFALPNFMQKRAATTYQPPVPQPQPQPREAPRPAPIPRPTPQPVPKPQPLPTMPARPPLSQPVVIKPKKPILPPLPPQYPTEPQEIDFDVSNDIDELVEEEYEPVVRQTVTQPSWALPQHRPLQRATPAPVRELSTAEIYGTGGGFKLPSFKFPSRKHTAPEPINDEYVGEQEPGIYTTSVAKRLAFISVGILLIYLGLTTTGSYYQPATQFKGDLATVFYVYQLGTLVAMAGAILVYDGIKRVR